VLANSGQALAQRTTMGVITGDMYGISQRIPLLYALTISVRFVNDKPLDSSFQRKTGYGMIPAHVSEARHIAVY